MILRLTLSLTLLFIAPQVLAGTWAVPLPELDDSHESAAGARSSPPTKTRSSWTGNTIQNPGLRTSIRPVTL